jgi:hypothetical protein
LPNRAEATELPVRAARRTIDTQTHHVAYYDNTSIRAPRDQAPSGCVEIKPVSLASTCQCRGCGRRVTKLPQGIFSIHRSSDSAFDRSKDILGLIVGQIDDQTLQEWQTLQKQASRITLNA